MNTIELQRPNLPDSWRIGQTIFNFLQWLDQTKKIQAHGGRMADPFYLSDENFRLLWEQFIAEMEAGS